MEISIQKENDLFWEETYGVPVFKRAIDDARDEKRVSWTFVDKLKAVVFVSDTTQRKELSRLAKNSTKRACLQRAFEGTRRYSDQNASVFSEDVSAGTNHTSWANSMNPNPSEGSQKPIPKFK